MKKIGKYLIIAIMLLGLFITPLTARGLDFGDFAGDSDWGDSSDDDDDWDSDWGNSRNDDNGSSGSHGSSSTGNASPKAMFTYMFIFFGACVGLVVLRNSKLGQSEIKLPWSKKGNSNKKSAIVPQESEPLLPMERYQEEDPAFSQQRLKLKLDDMYVRFQQAWQAKDISPLRQYMTDAFFAQMDTQLDSYRLNHETNYVEQIKVKNITLTGWKKENGLDVIVARLSTSIVDYVVDDNTGTVIRGSREKTKLMCYEWTLVKRSGFNATRSNGTTEQVCPRCGAKISMNQSAVCDYCGAVIRTNSFDWAVSNIKGISQKTL